MLLDAGSPLDTKASSGGTALMFAAAAGYTDVVTLLLDRGADVNATVKVFPKFDGDAFVCLEETCCGTSVCFGEHLSCTRKMSCLSSREWRHECTLPLRSSHFASIGGIPRVDAGLPTSQ